MSQTTHEDLERANNADSDQTGSTPHQPPQPSGGASSFGDSSGPLFSIYSKAAEEEDNKTVERWQKDADGILFFTGLFSAAVAALLAVTVQDLRPNIQDTSAFYLGNIYQVLADPNVTRSFNPSLVAKPPTFTPPRYAVWVNTLWFLSLVMSLSCALWATLLQQWARRYLRRAQPARCSPEKRARMRAFFAEGVDNMHIPWAVEGLPTVLHLSLFLFFGGLAIFLFNVDREVFSFVVWWIGLFSLVYGMITLLPIVRQDSTYCSPLSTPTWMLYTGIPFVYFRILAFVTYRWRSYLIWKDHRDHHHRRMLGGVDKAAEETVSKQISEIDSWILDWTITTLGDDDSLENFFGAIPGFFNSNLVNGKYSRTLEERRKLRNALDGFWDRTLLSNSASDSVKVCRLGITLEAMSVLQSSGVSSTLKSVLSEHHWDDVPHTLEMGQSLARWCTTGPPTHDKDTAYYARSIIARILAIVQERDDNWVSLATRVFGLPEQDLRDNIALGGDSVLLAILIHVTRPSLRPNYSDWMVLEAVSTLDIHNTLPRLQHDFCTLWNEVVQEAKNQGHYTIPVSILNTIHHLYIALHRRTDAAPTASGPSSYFRPTLWSPSSLSSMLHCQPSLRFDGSPSCSQF